MFLVAAPTVGAATRERCIYAVIEHSNIDHESSNLEILDFFKDGGDFEKAWRKEYVSAALENNIIIGYDDNTLRLTEEVTRAEFACMIYRAKDFYETPPIDKPIKYNGNYEDVSGWNEKEILYCIENGYLMGYGDKFGSSDVITDEQIDIVINRLKYGLSTKEKYSLYEVCGISPISMEKVLSSAYDEALILEKKPIGDEEVMEANSAVLSSKLEDLLETVGNMDYVKLKDEKYKRLILENFKGVGFSGLETNIVIKQGSESQSIEEKIKEAEDKKIKRESIVVISPINNWKVSFYTAFNKTVGVGYEYYCFNESADVTPNGEKIGVWYRRMIEVEFIQYITASSRYAELICKHGILEEI